MESPVLFSIILFVIVLWYVARMIIIIPARHFAIVEQLGSFHALLLPGWHFVLKPFQYVKQIKWTYRDQNNRLKIDKFTIGSIEDQQLDVPPLSCMCRDKLVVDFDITAMYTVIDPKLACYEHSDVLNFFYQCLMQAVRNVASHTDASDLQFGDAVVIAKRIEEQLNDQIQATGMKCKRIIIQNMKFSDDIIAKEQAIYANKRQQEMLIQEQRVEHERKMKALENERAENEMSNRIASETLNARLDRQRREHEMEHEYQNIMGWSSQDLLERERIHAMSTAFGNAPDKVVFAPMDYWTRPNSIASSLRFLNVNPN